MNTIFNAFEKKTKRYLPNTGEGDNKATQAVTAATKLIYKWFNDRDVFDNNYGLEGWANDLSSYANWLSNYIEGADVILAGVRDCDTNEKYEKLLEELAEFITALDLKELETHESIGTIYKCDGPYSFSDKCAACGAILSAREYSINGGYCSFCARDYNYEDYYDEDFNED